MVEQSAVNMNRSFPGKSWVVNEVNCWNPSRSNAKGNQQPILHSSFESHASLMEMRRGYLP